MSDVVTLAQRVSNLDVSPKFQPYSCVIINIDENNYVRAGYSSGGRTLEFDNPFGTQAMANDLLEKLNGFQYQPYKANGSLLDPAAEIGDAANIRGTYGGIYTRDRSFNRLMKADISAPYDEEINHEYAYEDPQTRTFTRQISDVKASLIIANSNIEAKVSKTSPEGQSSFSWVLDDQSHSWYSNGNLVMRVNQDGLMVKGEVQATSGTIGGFTIKSNSIDSGSSSNGVHIGTDGIRLGSNFSVTTSGVVTAKSINLQGNVNFRYSNGGYAGQLSANNLFTYAGYGNNYNNATNSTSGSYPSYFKVAGPLYCNSAHISKNLFDNDSIGHGVHWRYMQLNGSYYYFLCGN